MVLSMFVLVEELGPLSGVSTTRMGTTAPKLLACTVTVWFVGEFGGSMKYTAVFVPTGMLLPAACVMSKRGGFAGKTTM